LRGGSAPDMEARAEAAARSRMGWVLHALVDVALGIGLLIAGVHGHGDDYLALDAAGGYLLALTLLTNGPGGLWKVIPRLVHRALDGAVAVALLVSPLILWRFHVHIDVFATAMAGAVGVILLRDAIVSDHRAVPRRLIGMTATATGSVTRPIETRAFETPSDSARGGGRRAGRNVDQAARKLGKVSADLANQMPDAARRAGVLAGRTKRAARAARGARKGAVGDADS
jgi:hypothetical protein